MAATGRRNDQALSVRIPFMAAGPSKARTLQAAYMTATVSMPQAPQNQNSLALACERGPYMTRKAALPILILMLQATLAYNVPWPPTGGRLPLPSKLTASVYSVAEI